MSLENADLLARPASCTPSARHGGQSGPHPAVPYIIFILIVLFEAMGFEILEMLSLTKTIDTRVRPHSAASTHECT